MAGQQGATVRATAPVLVIEDDAALATVLTDLLETEGFRVTTGIGGAALATAYADPPSLVILDVMMPGMDGLEICRHLNAHPATRAVPILFLTAMPTELLAPHLADCVYDRLIRKPFDLADIIDVIRRHHGTAN